MKVQKLSDVPKQPVSSPLFTSENVSRQPLAEDSKDFAIRVVHFGKGVRNKYHTHESDQVLIVTDGRGFVETEHEHHDVHTGDVIFAPAGEKHRHGAASGSTFAHITITRADNKTVQIEP